MLAQLISWLMALHLLLPLLMTGFSLLLGLPLLALATEGQPLGKASGWRPTLGLLEAFGR